MNRIGERGESARDLRHWIFAGSIILQLACLGEGPSEDKQSGDEALTVKQSALTFEAPKFPISEMPMQVVNVNSGKCLDVAGAWTFNGAPIQQYACHGNSNQTFFFTPAGPDSYQIRLGHVGGKNVEVAGSGLDDHAAIQIDDMVTDNQIFGLVLQSDGSYEIVSKKSGKCLDVPSASLDDQVALQQYPCHGGSNQLWRLNPSTTTPMSLIAEHSGKCADVAFGSFGDQVPVQQLSCTGKPSQAWTLQTPTTVNGVTYYSLVASHSGRCLDVRGGSLDNGAGIQQYHCVAGAGNQLWSLTENADGYLTIKNQRSGKCLDVPGASQSDNLTLQQYACNGGANQRWYASMYADRHVQIVQVAASSGTGRQTQSDTAIADQLARYAGAYGRYGYRLSYDANADKSNVDNDALFHLGESGTTYTCPDASVGSPDYCAERYAYNWPGKVVIYSRPGASYSSGSASYIVVGALNSASTLACTNVPDTQVVAREFGHYMGLADTFAVGGDDLISDTRPDPQATTCLAPHSPTGMFNGATVDTNNTMSRYYNDTLAITPMQAAQTRATSYVRRTGYFAGECGGLSHTTCAPSNQFCEFATTGCTTNGPVGSCTVMPTTCPRDLVPVCGCDSVTYANDCERQAAGVSKWMDGYCWTQSCPAAVPTLGASCTLGNISCTYDGPVTPCLQGFSCVNGRWSSLGVACQT